MKPLSIQLQLTLMVSLLTLLIITVLSIAAYVEFEESLLGNIDTTLRAMGEGIWAEIDERDSRQHHEAEFQAITGRDASTHHSRYRIWTETDKEWVFLSDPRSDPVMQQLLHPPEQEQPEVGESSLFTVLDKAQLGPFRVIWMRYATDRDIVNILVARSCWYAYHEVGEFLQLLLISGGSIMLITLFLVPKIISWGLRPIIDAGRRMKHITHRSLGQECPIQGNVPAELQPFHAALDDMLARLNAALRQQEQFTADAAHDLRTPLATMKSTLQTLEIRPRTVAEYQESVNDVLRDIGRMERLVQQLLTLARLDAADTISDPAEVRLDRLLQSVADAFADRAQQQGTRLVYERHAALSVQGDETELWQLFSNLLDNALRYGPPNGAVRVILKDGPDPWATTCVHDEGGAILANELPRLFDRFYRVESSRCEASGGTGLGLAIAREIVRRHGGDIAITSDPQTGTSVTVRLPREQNHT